MAEAEAVEMAAMQAWARLQKVAFEGSEIGSKGKALLLLLDELRIAGEQPSGKLSEGSARELDTPKVTAEGLWVWLFAAPAPHACLRFLDEKDAWERPSEETKERIAIFNAVGEHLCAEPPMSHKWTSAEIALMLKRFSMANELSRGTRLQLSTEPLRIALRYVSGSPETLELFRECLLHHPDESVRKGALSAFCDLVTARQVTVLTFEEIMTQVCLHDISGAIRSLAYEAIDRVLFECTPSTVIEVALQGIEMEDNLAAPSALSLLIECMRIGHSVHPVLPRLTKALVRNLTLDAAVKSLKQLAEDKIASRFSLFVENLERLPGDVQESVRLNVSLGADTRRAGLRRPRFEKRRADLEDDMILLSVGRNSFRHKLHQATLACMHQMCKSWWSTAWLEEITALLTPRLSCEAPWHLTESALFILGLLSEWAPGCRLINENAPQMKAFLSHPSGLVRAVTFWAISRLVLAPENTDRDNVDHLVASMLAAYQSEQNEDCKKVALISLCECLHANSVQTSSCSTVHALINVLLNEPSSVAVVEAIFDNLSIYHIDLVVQALPRVMDLIETFMNESAPLSSDFLAALHSLGVVVAKVGQDFDPYVERACRLISRHLGDVPCLLSEENPQSPLHQDQLDGLEEYMGVASHMLHHRLPILSFIPCRELLEKIRLIHFACKAPVRHDDPYSYPHFPLRSAILVLGRLAKREPEKWVECVNTHKPCHEIMREAISYSLSLEGRLYDYILPMLGELAVSVPQLMEPQWIIELCQIHKFVCEDFVRDHEEGDDEKIEMNNTKIQAFLKIGYHFASEIVQPSLDDIIRWGAIWQPSFDPSEMIFEMIGLSRLLLQAIDEESPLGRSCLAACLNLVRALLGNQDWILSVDSDVSEKTMLTELKITVGAMLKAVLGMHQQFLPPELHVVDDLSDELICTDILLKEVVQWADDFLHSYE